MSESTTRPSAQILCLPPAVDMAEIPAETKPPTAEIDWTAEDLGDFPIEGEGGPARAENITGPGGNP